MKKFYYNLCLTLVAAILAVGCTEDLTTDNVVVNDATNYEMIEVVANLEIDEDTRTTLLDNNSGKVLWSEGDAIGAVLEDGTIVECGTKSVNGSEATFEVPSTTKYTIYPYSSKTTFADGKLSHTLVNTVALDGSAKVFGDGQNVMVAHLSEGTLPFKHLCGFIEVKLKGTGTVKHVALRSNAKNWDVMSGLGTINVSDATNPTFVPDSNHGTAYNWVYATCNNVELSKSEATSFYFIVPPRTYENLAICVQTDKGSYSVLSKNTITVNRSKIRPIAAIDIDTVKPTAATDLSVGGIANCYIVPQGGEAKYFSFPARKISSAANLEGAAYAHLVWSESSTLVTNVSYDAATGMVSFKYEGSNAEGNALISVLNSKHEILWSWHIWCTDQPQMLNIKANAVNTIYGQLDRNLGATYAPTTVAEATEISAENATKSAGLYYQYGRPTPFPRVKNIADKNAEETAFISNTNVAVEYGFRSYSQDFRRSTTTGFSMSTAVTYPNMFYAISYTDKTGAELGGNQSCNTWYSGAINPNTQKDQLWYSLNNDVVDKKADNDPCPAGYVPEEGWGVYNNRYAFTGVGSYGLYYTCPVTNNLMWFPLSGYRNHASGKASSIGSNFNIWAVPTMGTNNGAVSAVRWSANATTTTTNQLCYLDYNQLSQGFGVRCRVMNRSVLQGAVVDSFEGRGTEALPFLIKTPNDLAKLSGLCNGSVEATDEVDYTAAYYALDGNIDMTGATFTPITPFSGSFDGKSYSISNLTVTAVEGQPNGLFGTIENATIKNVTLDKYTLEVTSNTLHTGGIAGKATNSTITNCNIYGNVISSCSASFESVCGTNGASAVVGGVTGWAVNTNIANCNISGAVKSPTGQFVGGIVGHADGGSIDNCKILNGSEIYAKMNHIGGIVGRMTLDTEVTNCVVDAPVTCGYAFHGGIVGRMQSGVVRNCLVTNNAAISGHTYGTDNVGTGGIVGIIATAANLGTKVTIDNCACYTDISANGFTGGIVGEIGAVVSGYNVKIDNCHYNGLLTLKAKNGNQNWGNVGGIIGRVGATELVGTVSTTNCASLVNSIECNSVNVYIATGGLVGYTSSTTSFNNCYSNLAVANIKNIPSGKNQYGTLYGVAYWDKGVTMSNCYYLKDNRLGRDSGTPLVTAESGLTTTQMTNGTLLNKLQAVGGTWTANAQGYPVPAGAPANNSTVAPTPKGTRVSLIGDSISTFNGWMPAGYNSFYPKGAVTSATQTYWYKLIYNYMSNATLEKNIAWTGTVVARSTDANYLASDHGAGHCFVERFRDDGMGNPDVILLHGGTNDVGNRGKSIAVHPNYPTYGGSGYQNTMCPTDAEMSAVYATADAATTWDQLVALNDTSFVEAYTKLLSMMHFKHPNAKVVMIIGDKIHAGTSQAIQHIANHYGSKWGYKCVNLQDAACGAIGKLDGDTTHPSEAGFETMANYIYQQVGSYIDPAK